MNATRIRVGGREIEVREMAFGIFNAFDADGTRLAIAVRLSRGWWLGVRIGEARREMHIPDEPGDEEPIRRGAEEVTRRLLSP
ncbi:hypothetical protein GCM10023085_03100 [Actinomadura viridis]|uniref:Uncharacterized protein n=1 Tax=Actinomadura viridis TaxID=58110 RepID=A0A931GKQ2_9ACTN|nr:hypothetical protein [Actinomadura viridis]MBG6091128.1 hypothetical protein [Actinomadura viridis]